MFHFLFLLRCRQPRRGTSTLEVLMAFTLLTSVLGMSAPLIVKHGRLLRAQRDYRLAMDELSNQLDRLTALSPTELEDSLENLAPSPFIAERLSGAELTGELSPTDSGQRLVLQISWDEPNRRAAPLRMAGWMIARDDSRPDAQQE